MDKLLLGGKYNKSDEETTAMLDDLEEMSIYDPGCSSIEFSESDSDEEDLRLCEQRDDGPGTVECMK